MNNTKQTPTDEEQTKKYLVFEHKDGEDCNESLAGGRTHPKDSDVDKDDTFECVGLKCDNGELVYQRTVEIKTTVPEPSNKKVEFIDNLSSYERELYLGMVMESMRGSWLQPKERLQIIVYLCESNIDGYLSEEFLQTTKESAKGMYRRIKLPHKHIDGRQFRGNHDGCYGKLWNIVPKDIEIMRELSSYIPNDESWYEYKFEKLEEEQNE